MKSYEKSLTLILHNDLYLVDSNKRVYSCHGHHWQTSIE